MMVSFLPKGSLVKERAFALDGTQDAPLCDLAGSELSELEPPWKLFPAIYARDAEECNLTSTFRATRRKNWAFWCENCNLKVSSRVGELVCMDYAGQFESGS
jgi:hypothetical protein